MQDKPVSPDRPDNLFEPLPQLAGTHGIFDDQAKTRSPQMWMATHRPAVLRGAGRGRRLPRRASSEPFDECRY